MPLLTTFRPALDTLPKISSTKSTVGLIWPVTLVAAPHLVNLLKAKSSDDPISEAAAMLDALPEFVAAHYECFNKHVDEGRTRRRNREIIRLARTLTNKEIMARTGLSVRQIQRILKVDDLGDYAR